eukprot:3676330-Ditylum_brightwellii.AAC.1
MNGNTCINARIIPTTLLLCDGNKYNTEWARNTYKCVHLFNAMQFNSVAYNDNNDIDRLLEIAVKDYNLKMPTTSTQSP